jgi:hypothetical protein
VSVIQLFFVVVVVVVVGIFVCCFFGGDGGGECVLVVCLCVVCCKLVFVVLFELSAVKKRGWVALRLPPRKDCWGVRQPPLALGKNHQNNHKQTNKQTLKTHLSLPSVSVISLDSGGLQNASQRRGVTPLVLFWNFSGNSLLLVFVCLCVGVVCVRVGFVCVRVGFVRVRGFFCLCGFVCF